jgi:hypothetical protein
MRFRLEQRLASAPADVSRAFTEPGFYAGLRELPKLSVPEVLEISPDGARVRLRLRYRFTGDLNAAARAVLDPQRLSWVEDSVHDLDGKLTTFRLVPDHYGDRFSCSGRSSFEAHGGGTLRVTEGELKVRWPFVGGKVEQALVSGLREHFDAEAPFIDGYLSQG